MSYKLMKNNNNFKCFVDGKNVNFEYKTDNMLDEFKNVYEKWILNMGYDLEKIKKITSLIFLNVSHYMKKNLVICYFLNQR